ncbi:glycosyltransferase [Candidatus Mancarchaeum acidiphilum]|uniref:Glycosyltransferase n=1 Tax=Candidatus Mancarchaeum acidiphilum TaxID=1920749 RepID=A0A218NNZ6_9ARCH|nr:glycosyltransferase [Candidatus Mancarchaeum acidiphilum]ASI14183.1 glycosyltransferase [Candidatus Mancarchaeum acidiphilum]
MGYSYYRNRRFSVRLFTVILFVILAFSGVGFSIYLFYVAKSLYVYVIAIGFLLLSVISGGFNLYASMFYYKSYFYKDFLRQINYKLNKKIPEKDLPTVAVAVPVYNENPKILKSTMENLSKMKYPKKKANFYLLDDSTDKRKAEIFKEFSKLYGFRYIHRKNRKAFKAGALNNLLGKMKEEYLAVFDYDEKLVNRNFLLDIIPYFNDKNVSYVQTKKDYVKTGELFPDSCTLFDSFFFDFIEPSRAMDNTAIFAGSCGIIRKSTLKLVGGFPEYIVEDTFFSFESNIRKFKGLYIPKIYALGESMKTFTDLAKQQWRYNYGDTQFLSYFLHRTKNVKTLKERADYFTHGFGLNYISVLVVLFTLISIFIVFSNVPFTALNFYKVLFAGGVVSSYLYLEIFGMVALVGSFLGPAIMTKIYFGSFKRGVMFYLLNFALAIIRTKAALSAVLHTNTKINWSRGNGSITNNLFYSIINTKVELGFAFFIFMLSYIASITNHVSGGVWLLMYGMLYLTTTIFTYKYK